MREVNLFEKEKGPPYHDNVLNMGDFLFRKHNKLFAEHERLTLQAEALSKQDKDKFAAPVRAKAESFQKQMDKISDQLKFIIRGGLPQAAPPPGFMNYGFAVPGGVLRQPWVPSIVPPPGYVNSPQPTGPKQN